MYRYLRYIARVARLAFRTSANPNPNPNPGQVLGFVKAMRGRLDSTGKRTHGVGAATSEEAMARKPTLALTPTLTLTLALSQTLAQP